MRTRNLAQLLLQRAMERPNLVFGMADDLQTLGHAMEAASRVVAGLEDAGIVPGSRLAFIADPDTSYLVMWLSCQLAGVQPVLVNPRYPIDLLRAMMADIEPAAIVAEPSRELPEGMRRLDHSLAPLGRISIDGSDIAPSRPATRLPGEGAAPSNIAGFMHTSGTTGSPKFCAQTHEYFLRLGRYVASILHLTPDDTVLAPLPMFHINPLGYGVIGGLAGGANVVGLRRFAPESFWGVVHDVNATALILHAQPVEVLKSRTSPSDAKGHRVRIAFYADLDFLRRFSIPCGVSAYGSTEAGGISHTWLWQASDRVPSSLGEGVARYGGQPRADLECRLAASREILLREREAGALFAGYWHRNALNPSRDEDGWFHTGDLGRFDSKGNLVFIERISESIRVRGEYVPIDYVEQRVRTIPGLTDAALWKEPSGGIDDDPVLYVVAEASVPLEEIRTRISELPRFMRPVKIVRVRSIPRDTGAGKVQRRLLTNALLLERWVP